MSMTIGEKLEKSQMICKQAQLGELLILQDAIEEELKRRGY